MHVVHFDWSTKFGLYCLAFVTALFIARIYYYGWRLRLAREKGRDYPPSDLEAKRLSVIGAAVSTVMLLIMIEWSLGQFGFLTDLLHLPRAIPPKSGMGPAFLATHILIALATAAMFGVIALRVTGLRYQLAHRKLVYKCLGLIMLTGLMGSVLLATLH